VYRLPAFVVLTREDSEGWPGSKFLAEGGEISFVYFSDIYLKTTEIQNFLHSAQAALSHPSGPLPLRGRSSTIPTRARRSASIPT
jgi:hypothetical protein